MGILGGGESEAEYGNENASMALSNDPFLAFYQQLPMEDRQAIAEYADNYVKGKRAEDLQTEKQVITIN